MAGAYITAAGPGGCGPAEIPESGYHAGFSIDWMQAVTSPSALPSAEALFDQMADAVYLIDPVTSAIVWGNRAAWAMLGLSREDVLDHSVLSLQLDVTGLPQWSEIAAAIRGQECFTFVGRHRHREGHEIHVEVNTTHFCLDGHAYFLSVARDVRRRMALEKDMQSRENQLWFALNEAADGLWDWEIATGRLFFSPQLKRMLGYSPDEMEPVLATWSDALHPDDRQVVLGILQAHLDGKRVRYEAEYRLRNRNGRYLWVHDRGRVCERDGLGAPTRAVGMVQDITARKELELQLQQLASSDTLTGLPNRRHGERFLEAELALCRRLGLPLGVCFFDVDHFKRVNDSFGHLVGDTVLQQVAEQAQASIRRSDLVCRWGGEEFVIISPNSNRAQLLQVAEKVRKAVMVLAGTPRVTVSLGVAAFPEDGDDVEALLGVADGALYRAKTRGRNRAE